ncbi:hypothetical protein [Methylobacterium marchantiae]|uniref:YiaAB two helix domain-containing protein n=1 Tax=Methylobacterium marchantiae TaxID=600331 RepID=A0ABW3WXR7_9HYPH|nr:hypothetical protein AIGOOFII_3142 [Methylobacterium marchantiae]
MNRAFDRSFGTILAINGHFLMSGLCGGLAWLIWPRTPEWWGLGVFSVFLAFAAMIAFLKAVRAIVGLHGRERAVAEFESLGKSPKSSEMASRDALIRAGMLDE